MPREQFIAPAGVAAGDPFLLLGFLPLDFLLVVFFLVGFLPLGLPERSRFATLREPGVSRPFFGRVPSESGRDLPSCDSQANPDHFSHPRCPHASRLPPPDALPPPDPHLPSAPLPLPIGGPTQIETFVATRDAKLFR